jgi:excinuclease UvrABC helicase subunit UvrB
MRLFRFVNRHAAHEDDRTNLERWWPYVLRVHGTARCLRAAQNGEREEAVKILNDVRREIEALKDVDAQEFFVERERSLEALDSLESSLDEQREPTRRETLEIELDRALANEAYELAATLRDELQALDDIRVD